MDEKITVRLFYTPKCSSGGCGCAPDINLKAFGDAAKRLTKKFGEGRISFEAYTSIDRSRFAFMRNAKQTPIVAVNDCIVSSGKKPELSEIERELTRLKVI